MSPVNGKFELSVEQPTTAKMIGLLAICKVKYMLALEGQINLVRWVLNICTLFFILVINQLDAQNLFYNKFISCLYMFRAPCAHRQKVKIVLYSIRYHHICRWLLCTGRPPIGVMIPDAV